ncbi:MAG TPA: hypothetical protein VLA35_02120, partial [Thermoleophilia bacterium]|nr:hypothetical protein [Thermoleophilia bacterium]
SAIAAAPTNGGGTAGTTAETTGGTAGTTAASAAAATEDAETADAADAPDTSSEPTPAAAANVDDPAASPPSPTDPALLGYDEEDEVLHGEVVDDEPAPLSAPSAPSTPRDADPA